MSETRRVRSVNGNEDEGRPVLGRASSKTRSVPCARKPSLKLSKKPDKDGVLNLEEEKKKEQRPLVSSLSAPSGLRGHELLVLSNLSLDASCSSDASTDSFRSRASTGRIGSTVMTGRRRRGVPMREKIAAKLEKILLDGGSALSVDGSKGKRRCAWVTPNTEPVYALFNDEEWGIPAHDDKRLFELLALSAALGELSWPVILSKRHIFREVFMDFDPVAVSNLNEKKIIAPGRAASSLLSEPKLRGIIEIRY